MITSYAQNFEDVMLWRALKHVPNGCYVDVGAHHPVMDSVSRLFYEKGWRGIHIEPVPEYAQLLQRDRPDEKVLQVAVSDSNGVVDLTVIEGTGLSTTVTEHADRHTRGNAYVHQKIQVPCLTLASALASLEGRPVHWLKIDVEGVEEQVLKGWDSTALRPWVLVVEATVPGSAEANFAGWESIVLNAGYTFAYFDGLNRFYVANEHSALMQSFAVPPNVFDEFCLSGLSSSSLCRLLSAKLEAKERELAEAKSGLRIAVYKRRLKSTFTKALHTMKRAAHAGKGIAKRILRRLLQRVLASPYLARSVRKALTRFPALNRKLKRIYSGSSSLAIAKNTFSGKPLRAWIRGCAHFTLNTLRTRVPRVYGVLSRNPKIRLLYHSIIVRCSDNSHVTYARGGSSNPASIVRAHVPLADNGMGRTLEESLERAVNAWPLGGRV